MAVTAEPLSMHAEGIRTVAAPETPSLVGWTAIGSIWPGDVEVVAAWVVVVVESTVVVVVEAEFAVDVGTT